MILNLAINPSHRLLGAALAAACLPLLGQKVVVERRGMVFQAGTNVHHGFSAVDPEAYADRFQFKARLEGGEPYAGPWDWSVVGMDGQTVLPDGGSITSEGLYTPPLLSLRPMRPVKIKAASRLAPALSGTVLVMITPHGGLVPLEKILNGSLAGPRVEVLAGAKETGYRRQDSACGVEAEFVTLSDVAFAARIPWKGTEDLRDEWLVTEGGSVRCISLGGRVRTLAETKDAFFVRVAVKPWRGPEDGAWECFLYDTSRYTIWKLGAEGGLARLSGEPQTGIRMGAWGCKDGSKDTAVFRWVDAMAADRKGGLYVTDLRHNGQHVVRRVAPDGSVTTLPTFAADGKSAAPPFTDLLGLALDEAGQVLYALDGKGTKARIHMIALADGVVRTLPVGRKDFTGDLTQLAFHRNQLVVGTGAEIPGRSGGEPLRLFTVNPGTSRITRLFEDPFLPCLTPGPCLAAGQGSATVPKGGSLGKQAGCFAIGDQGQIAALCGQQLGLLLLDWPAAETLRATSDQETKETGIERKEPPSGDPT